MADAQIELRTGSTLIARNATQSQITALSSTPPVGFVHIGDVTIAVDLIASAYMLDEKHVPKIYTETTDEGVREITQMEFIAGQQRDAGHRYTEADLAPD